MTNPMRNIHQATLAAAQEFAARHFSDPAVTLEDFAAFWGMSPRYVRVALDASGPSWRALLLELRIARAEQLLTDSDTRNFRISAIARLCGYSNAPAFAKAFARVHRGVTPGEFRRGQNGIVRAGGPTGAFKRPARRAQERRDGTESDSASHGLHRDEHAVLAVEQYEAAARLEDQNLLLHGQPLRGVSLEEITSEWLKPTRMRHDPARWKQARVDLDAWVEAHDPGLQTTTDSLDPLFWAASSSK